MPGLLKRRCFCDVVVLLLLFSIFLNLISPCPGSPSPVVQTRRVCLADRYTPLSHHPLSWPYCYRCWRCFAVIVRGDHRRINVIRSRFQFTFVHTHSPHRWLTVGRLDGCESLLFSNKQILFASTVRVSGKFLDFAWDRIRFVFSLARMLWQLLMIIWLKLLCQFILIGLLLCSATVTFNQNSVTFTISHNHSLPWWLSTATG